MRTTAVWGALALVMVGCGPILDDDDGEPAVVATNTGAVQRIGAAEELVSVLWSGTIDASSSVSILADGSDVFVGSGQEVRAFDDGDGGNEVWDPPVSFATEVVALAGPGGGNLFVLTIDSLVALNVADGSEVWRQDLFDLGDPANDALAFGAGAVFLGGDPISRLDPATGDVTHTADGTSQISDVVVDGNSVFVGGPDGVTAFGATSLGESWHHPTSGDVDALAVGNGTVLYSVFGGDGGMGALTSSGNPIGEAEPGEVFQTVAVAGSLLLGARADGTLVALDAADLGEVWTAPGDSTVWGLSTNAQTVFYATGGALDGLNLDDGSQLWDFAGNGDIVEALAL